MEFDEHKYIKSTVKGIYDDKKYPRIKEVAYDGRINELPNEKVLGSYLYADDASCLQQIPEDLAEIKGLDNCEELFKAYANFGKDLFNNNRANLNSIRRLLEEKLNELEEAYFMQTKPLMKFLIHDEIAEKIYSLDAFNFERLASMLCYMNLLGFEKLLKEMDEVFEIFTSYKIAWKINEDGPFSDEEFAMSLSYPTDGEYLIRVMSRGKDLILRYNDIKYKHGTIDSILKSGLFNYKKTSISKIKNADDTYEGIVDDLTNKFLKESEELSKDKLEDWIRQISKNISSNGNSKIDNPKTIELYLKYLVDNPLAGVVDIQEELSHSSGIPKSDEDIFSELSYGTLRGWEKKLFNVLESRCYNKYAQRFSRFSSSE